MTCGGHVTFDQAEVKAQKRAEEELERKKVEDEAKKRKEEEEQVLTPLYSDPS